MNYDLKEISAMLSDVDYIGTTNRTIRRLLTDSRSLSSPEDTLFFAIVTRRGDGHSYIDQLYRRGVRAFVVSRRPDKAYSDAVFLLVPDTLCALQQLAAGHRKRFRIPVVGITGSNGKTVVKEWLAQMLSPDFRVCRSPRSYNSQIGVPLSVWNLGETTEIGIFEAAISEPGEMARLAAIVSPTIGVFTGLGDAHQENFDSYKQKCMEKLSLFRNAEAIIYPSGNRVVDICVREMNFPGRLIPVPVGSDDTGGMTDSWLIDKALCAAACRYLGLLESEIERRASALEPVPMRLEVVDGQGGCTLINDSYNNDFESLRIALEFMRRRPDGDGRRHTLVLSDMEQTGWTTEQICKELSVLLRQMKVDTFVGVGDGLSTHAAVFSKDCGASCHFFRRTDELLASPLLAGFRNEVILIKGARSFHFEDVVSRLTARVHETILEVDLNAIVANLNHYRAMMAPHVRLVCMVKADAYGMGSVEVARQLQDNGVEYMAVAVADEGVELRRAGISCGIMVMNPEMSSFRTLFRHNLEPEVYSFRLLDALIAAAEREGIKGFPIHIKLDTGMHRLGFDPLADMSRLTDRLSQQDALLPRSVFSHFAGSDEDRFDDFSQLQYSRFLAGADALQAAYPQHHILRHICNSAGIEHLPQCHQDMVRLGLGLYGVNPRNNALINNVATLKTTILQIHDVPKEETVGYSRKGQLSRDGRIAVLPIGYADGLDRRLGNGVGYCLVGGCRAPYVGNICMDVCMIDVTDIPCQEGGEAVIFGQELPVSELSSAIGTIPYEILTGVSNRVRRIYYKQ